MEKVGYYGYRGAPFGGYSGAEHPYYLKLWLEGDIITQAEVISPTGVFQSLLSGWIRGRKPEEWTEVFGVGDPDLRMDEGL